MDEIIKIIYNANKERRLFTFDEVIKICSLVIDKKQYDFVSTIRVYAKTPSQDIAQLDNGELIFYYKEVLKYLEESCDKFTDMYHIEGTSIDVLNFYYLVTIMHELAHLRQIKYRLSEFNSLEKDIFTLFNNLSMDYEFYRRTYDYNLNEVNAENVAYITSQYLFSKLPPNFVTPNDKRVYQQVVLARMLYANYEVDYKEASIYSPSERITDYFTDEIFKKNNFTLNQYADIVTRDNLTVYKKLLFGLPISLSEYSYVDLINGALANGENVNAVKRLQKRIDG